MSYTTKPQALGASIGDVTTIATAVVSDPCLTQVATLARRLYDIEQASPTKPAAPGVPRPPAPPMPGIGLCKAVTPLKAVVFVRERPWILPVGVIGIVGGLIGLGYVLGATRGK